jgi:hypothetical protein
MEKSISRSAASMNQPSEKSSDPERNVIGLHNSGRPAESRSVDFTAPDDQMMFSMANVDPVLDAKMRLINKVSSLHTNLQLLLVLVRNKKRIHVNQVSSA